MGVDIKKCKIILDELDNFKKGVIIKNKGGLMAILKDALNNMVIFEIRSRSGPETGIVNEMDWA